jgi:hypothetical protein
MFCNGAAPDPELTQSITFRDEFFENTAALPSDGSLQSGTGKAPA